MKEHMLATLGVAAAALVTGLVASRWSDASAGDRKEAGKTVTVLRDEDCGGPAIAKVKEVATRLGLTVEVVEVIVTTPEQAVQHRYFGSPTVRIKGLDIDPRVRSRTSYGLG